MTLRVFRGSEKDLGVASFTESLPAELVLDVPKEVSTFDDEASVRSAGTEDGKNRVPAEGAYAVGQYEQGLLARGAARVSAVTEAAQKARAVVNRELQPVISQLKSVNGRWRKINEALLDRKTKLGREFIIPVNKVFHWLLIGILSVGEFPLNALVFRMFGETEIMTYVMSSTLAITIPLIALYLGVLIRHSVSRIFGNIIVGVLLPVSVFGSLGAVTYVRTLYLKTHGHVASAASAGGNGMWYSIFALNLLVFTAALVTSYLAHDPDEQMDHLRKDILAIDKIRKPLLSKYAELASRMNAILRVAQEKVQGEQSRTKALVNLYRQENIRARAPLAPPLSFHKAPDVPKATLWEPLPENPDEV